MTVPLAESLGASHRLDIASDSPSSLLLPAGFDDSYDRLVAEFHALFGARHYRGYRFLVALWTCRPLRPRAPREERQPHARERRSAARPQLLDLAGLLPTSTPTPGTASTAGRWGSRPRLPRAHAGRDAVGLRGADAVPRLRADAAQRAVEPGGLPRAPGGARRQLDHQSGRAWRPLADTAASAQILFGSASEWRTWRRAVDFYDESVLLWLEADA